MIRETIDAGSSAAVVIDYMYDNSGAPYKIRVSTGGSVYTGYFILNQQGDVIAIINSSGNVLVNYSYNAWGAQTTSSYNGTAGAALYTYNALKYRGYYCDSETGFYYLQTRYYDPTIGRFINADGKISSVGGELLGFNMYTYCLNNPVNLDDQDGNAPKWLKNIAKKVKKVVKTVTRLVKKAASTAKKIIKIVRGKTSTVNITNAKGINISETVGFINISGQIGTAIDSKGNVALQVGYGAGFTISSDVKSINGSLSMYNTITNAPSVDKLKGYSDQMGGSVVIPVEGVPVSVGVDINHIPDEELNTEYYGVTANVGITSSLPGVEGHIIMSDTYNLFQINLFDVAESICDKIAG